MTHICYATRSGGIPLNIPQVICIFSVFARDASGELTNHVVTAPGVPTCWPRLDVIHRTEGIITTFPNIGIEMNRNGIGQRSA